MNTPARYHKGAMLLLRLYPRIWRERYEDEMLAVLEEGPATLRTLFSLSLGVLDAYLHTHFLTSQEVQLEMRLRNSQFQVFASCFLFLAPFLFLGLYNSSDQQAYTGQFFTQMADLSPLRWFGLFSFLSMQQGGMALAIETAKLLTIACLLAAFLALACVIVGIVVQATRQVLQRPRLLLTRLPLVWMSSLILLAVALLTYDWLLWRTLPFESGTSFVSFLRNSTLLGMPLNINTYFSVTYADAQTHAIPICRIVVSVLLVWNVILLMALFARGINRVYQGPRALRVTSHLARVVTIALCFAMVFRLFVSTVGLVLDWQSTSGTAYYLLTNPVFWRSTAWSYLSALWLAVMAGNALLGQRRIGRTQQQFPA